MWSSPHIYYAWLIDMCTRPKKMCMCSFCIFKLSRFIHDMSVWWYSLNANSIIHSVRGWTCGYDNTFIISCCSVCMSEYNLSFLVNISVAFTNFQTNMVFIIIINHKNVWIKLLYFYTSMRDSVIFECLLPVKCYSSFMKW